MPRVEVAFDLVNLVYIEVMTIGPGGWSRRQRVTRLKWPVSASEGLSSVKREIFFPQNYG